jgi:hypothetical protein
VMPNMNMQIPHTISPVRMFLRASRRVIMSREEYLLRPSGPRSTGALPATYRWTSATIAQNSSAR